MRKYQFGGHEETYGFDFIKGLTDYLSQPQEEFAAAEPMETTVDAEDMTDDDYQDLLDRYTELEDKYNDASSRLTELSNQPVANTNYDDGFLNFLFNDSENKMPVDFTNQTLDLSTNTNYRGANINFKSGNGEGFSDRASSVLNELGSQFNLTVTSGRRSAKENSTVGGAPTSFHLTGDAIDLRPSDELNKFFASPQGKKFLTDKGYEVIDERNRKGHGAHWHLEPVKRQTGGYVNIDSTLNANRNVPFVDRILNAKKYPVRKNPDGTVSTHLMSTASDDQGAFAYPSLRYVNGKWIENSDPLEAIRQGDIIRFKDEMQAEYFSKNYKGAKSSGIKHQTGGQVQPVYTNDPNDPRLKRFRDSSNIYNQYQNLRSEIKKLDASKFHHPGEWNNLVIQNYYKKYPAFYKYIEDSNPKATNEILKSFEWTGGEGRMDVVGTQVKKPVQPILYQDHRAQFMKNVKGDELTTPQPSISAQATGTSNISGRPQNPTEFSYSYRDEQGQQQTKYFPNWESWNQVVQNQPYIDAPTNVAKTYGHATGHYLKQQYGGEPVNMQMGGALGFARAAKIAQIKQGAKDEATPTNIEDERKFFEEYLKSDKYIERLKGQGYEFPYTTRKSRLENVQKTGAVDLGGLTTIYADGSNKVVMDRKFNRAYNLPLDDAEAHEMAHAAGALVMQKNHMGKHITLNQKDRQDLYKRNKHLQGPYDHDSKPHEMKADIDTLRYYLKKDGIYNTINEEFNGEILKKAKEKYKNHPIINRLFMNVTSDDDLIWLMNNIADVQSKNPDAEEVSIAQQGGMVEANTDEELYNGLNTSNADELMLNLPSQYNLIRGLDSGEPVFIKDELGNSRILIGSHDQAHMFGKVREQRLSKYKVK